MERRRELPLATQTTSTGLSCRNIEDTDDTTTTTITTVLPLMLKKRSTTNTHHENRRLQKSTK